MEKPFITLQDINKPLTYKIIREHLTRGCFLSREDEKHMHWIARQNGLSLSTIDGCNKAFKIFFDSQFKN